MTDSEVVQVVARARNAHKVLALLAGDTSDYDDERQADMALCGSLAPYVDGELQLRRLWLSSGLARPALSERGYVARTVRRAIKRRSFTYSPHFARLQSSARW
jgi:hypothetical protein